MNPLSSIPTGLGLVLALTIALPSIAEEQPLRQPPPAPSTPPVATPAHTPSRGEDFMQKFEAPAAGVAVQKDEAPDPGYTPYLTYDGAVTSNTDR